MPKANGSVSEIQLLRPTAWLERNDIVAIGKSTYLKLPEMGLEGYATVTDLAHFRVTKSNTASEEDWAAGMVTGVFKHIVNGVYHLRYDNDDTLGVTGTHPLYSLDRQQFIPTEDIKVGEHLLSKSGIITVVSKTYDPTPQEVYNLEVGQWHNFLVGSSGVVAHNGCVTPEDITNFYKIDRTAQSLKIVENKSLTNFAKEATKDEVVAIHRYTLSNFELSANFYKNTLSDLEKSWVKLINSGLDNLSKTKLYKGIVFRGSNLYEQTIITKYEQPFLK